jgi:hypothetical protein
MNWYQSDESDSSFWLFSSSLLKPICSAVVTNNYASGQFLSDTLGSLAPGVPPPILLWANDEGASYSRDRIPLRVTVEDRGHILLLDERSCPRLFLRVRDATPGRVISSRSTRVDELQRATCKTEGVGVAGSRFIMDFDGSYAVRPKKNDQNKGEYTLDVSSLEEIQGRYLFVPATPALHISVVDGKLIRRNWGPAVQIAVADC